MCPQFQWLVGEVVICAGLLWEVCLMEFLELESKLFAESADGWGVCSVVCRTVP